MGSKASLRGKLLFFCALDKLMPSVFFVCFFLGVGVLLLQQMHNQSTNARKITVNNVTQGQESHYLDNADGLYSWFKNIISDTSQAANRSARL